MISYLVTRRGAADSIQTEGLIIAKRHIHMNSKDAETRGLKHGDQIEVVIDGKGNRDLVFRDVIVRVDPRFITEMHIDTDEANVAHIEHGGVGELIPVKGCAAHITQHHTPVGNIDKSCCLNDSKNKATA